MPKFLPGLTHAIVKMTKNKEAMDKLNGAIAMVSLCFTSDEDCIWVSVSKMTGPTTGVVADLPCFTFPMGAITAIRGKLANELKLEALMAFDRVKQQHGVKWNKRYKVFEKSIEVLDEPKTVGATV